MVNMKMLILNHAQDEQLLPMAECISAMEQAFAALAGRQAQKPLRTIFKPPEVKGLLAMMPTFSASPSPMFGLKAICVFPGNAAIGKDAHQGGVMLFDGETGELLTVINASAITAIRTAAVSGLATRLLSREDACDLAIIGAGVQARSHLAAMICARPLKRVRIAARSFENAKNFASEMQPQSAVSIEPVANVEAAVRGADLIVTATTSRDPVLRREWISPGAHINAIGTFSPKAREVDTATIAAASLFVDCREAALNEAGDYLIAAQEGAIGPEHIRADLGEVLTGVYPGRTSPEEITA